MAKTLDRFDLMRLFVRIADTGSLTAAGKSLGLSQPSASRQLRELETEFGAQLVMRSTHELTLTEAGQEFLADARRLLGEWEVISQRYRVQRGELEGRIRIAAPSGFGQTILADLAGRFIERHPGVSIDWRLDDHPRDLIGQGFDLWIRVGPVADQSLIVRGIWRIERLLVAAAASGIEAEQPGGLAGRPAIVLSPYVGREVELTGPGGEKHALEPAVAFGTDNLFAAERLTRAGRGYSVLPRWLIQDGLDDGSLRILCPSWRPPPLSLSIAYPQSRFRPARVASFIDFLRREIPRTGAGIEPLERS